MAGNSTDSGLIAQAIGRYFTFKLLVIPAVALLMLMIAYVGLRGNRVSAVGARDYDVSLGQQSLATGTQQGEDFALDTRGTGTPRDGGQETGFSNAIQGNDEYIDVEGTQESYSNVTATTGFYVDWGAEDNGILSAFLGHLKKSLPKARIYHPADQVVPVASEA